MRTPLARRLRVKISPRYSPPPICLKVPMVAMWFLPWLFDPAAIAVSMAIDRPRASDDATVRAGAQRRMAARDFLVPRGPGDNGPMVVSKR
jgi:hypothetical protein